MLQIDTLLTEMRDRKASDLHMVVGRPPIFRESGEIVESEHARLTAEASRELLFEMLNPAQRETIETHLDLDFAYELGEVARFRVNMFHQHRGLGAVFRLIPSKILRLDDLGMPPAVTALADASSGLVLVTGPTGSGKSTTLAAMIDYINDTRDAHIITIEDPVEFIHGPKRCLITQREVGIHTNSFASALRVAGRQDPDIVLVGEMRDLETISLALTSAACGMLVFGTLHTNSAIKTVDRIIDAYPAEEQNQVRAMLSDSLRGVVAQQLVKTSEGGRCAAVEILLGSKALGNIIREGKTSMIPSYMQSGVGDGMQTMDQALVALIQAGKITPADAVTKASDKALFERMAAGGPVPPPLDQGPRPPGQPNRAPGPAQPPPRRPPLRREG
jgi:twitching motility protein PilT